MKWWNSISNLGISPDELSAATKRKRLTNRMILIGSLLTVPYYPIFISHGEMVPLIQVILLTVLLLGLFLFTRKNKHETAGILLCLITIAHLVSTSIIIEGGTGRFFLVPISILGFTLIRSIKTGTILFFVAMAAFFFSLRAPDFIEPIVPENEKSAEITFIINMVLIFLGTLYFILQLKSTNRKYEKDIIKQKETIQEQHHELYEIHSNIQDSIVYAKRIQTALLPPDALIKTHLPESFVLYKPKDVIAGDFYWLEHQKNMTFFAAVDCTGHGVPGAMVSVICNNALNRTVREYGIFDPGKILDKSREIVVAEFEKSEDDVRDGMDIALCVLDGKKLLYAGAHNPCWIVRNNEIIQLKADRQPIGAVDNKLPFTTHTFDLLEGDMLYLFSDGYSDQFGGEQGKKFKLKNFMELIISISEKAVEEQKEILDSHFEEWRGPLEQIDDVCVLGVRI